MLSSKNLSRRSRGIETYCKERSLLMFAGIRLLYEGATSYKQISGLMWVCDVQSTCAICSQNICFKWPPEGTVFVWKKYKIEKLLRIKTPHGKQETIIKLNLSALRSLGRRDAVTS